MAHIQNLCQMHKMKQEYICSCESKICDECILIHQKHKNFRVIAYSKVEKVFKSDSKKIQKLIRKFEETNIHRDFINSNSIIQTLTHITQKFFQSNFNLDLSAFYSIKNEMNQISTIFDMANFISKDFESKLNFMFLEKLEIDNRIKKERSNFFNEFELLLKKYFNSNNKGNINKNNYQNYIHTELVKEREFNENLIEDLSFEKEIENAYRINKAGDLNKKNKHLEIMKEYYMKNEESNNLDSFVANDLPPLTDSLLNLSGSENIKIGEVTKTLRNETAKFAWESKIQNNNLRQNKNIADESGELVDLSTNISYQNSKNDFSKMKKICPKCRHPKYVCKNEAKFRNCDNCQNEVI